MMVAKGEELVSRQAVGQVGFDAYFASRQDAQRDSSGVETLLELRDAGADVVASIMAEASQLMRRGDDRRRAVGRRQPRHCERLVPAGWAVVDAGQDVAVDIDKR